MSKSKDDIDPKALAFGRRIATAREQKGYSQDDFAIRLRITKGAVGQWETGRSQPRPWRLTEIAEELGVSVRWLLTGNEPEELVRAQTRSELETLEVLRDIPPAQQPAALSMLRAYREGITKK